MYALVMDDLELAQRMCAELAAHPEAVFPPVNGSEMDRVQRRFQATFSRIAQASGVEPKAKN